LTPKLKGCGPTQPAVWLMARRGSTG
jgi:hypothetical protein